MTTVRVRRHLRRAYQRRLASARNGRTPGPCEARWLRTTAEGGEKSKAVGDTAELSTRGRTAQKIVHDDPAEVWDSLSAVLRSGHSNVVF
jgi:hypothetical protein